MKARPNSPCSEEQADLIRDVQEWRFQQLAVLNDADPAHLLHDKEPPAAVASMRDKKGLLQVFDQGIEAHGYG